MRISDWSSDVCSSDLHHRSQLAGVSGHGKANSSGGNAAEIRLHARDLVAGSLKAGDFTLLDDIDTQSVGRPGVTPSHRIVRSEEHTSELQSLMRISYAVFCLKKKKRHTDT